MTIKNSINTQVVPRLDHEERVLVRRVRLQPLLARHAVLRPLSFTELIPHLPNCFLREARAPVPVLVRRAVDRSEARPLARLVDPSVSSRRVRSPRSRSCCCQLEGARGVGGGTSIYLYPAQAPKSHLGPAIKNWRVQDPPHESESREGFD